MVMPMKLTACRMMAMPPASSVGMAKTARARMTAPSKVPAAAGPLGAAMPRAVWTRGQSGREEEQERERGVEEEQRGKWKNRKRNFLSLKK